MSDEQRFVWVIVPRLPGKSIRYRLGLAVEMVKGVLRLDT